MFDKEINISGWLKEWLGENPTIGEIFVIFGTALLATGLLLAGYYDALSKLSFWRSVMFIVVAFDIIGGAVANFTDSTDRYYSHNSKKRWMFFAEHIVHFTLFYIAIGGDFLFWISIFAYTMVTAALVNLIREKKLQELAASAFVTVGCMLFYSFDFLVPLMSWFPAIFMIKIIIGFSVRRTQELSY